MNDAIRQPTTRAHAPPSEISEISPDVEEDLLSSGKLDPTPLTGWDVTSGGSIESSRTLWPRPKSCVAAAASPARVVMDAAAASASPLLPQAMLTRMTNLVDAAAAAPASWRRRVVSSAALSAVASAVSSAASSAASSAVASAVSTETTTAVGATERSAASSRTTSPTLNAAISPSNTASKRTVCWSVQPGVSGGVSSGALASGGDGVGDDNGAHGG